MNRLFSSAFRSLRMLCSVVCFRCNIAVAIAYGRLDSTSKRHGSASDRECWRIGRRNNPAVYERQLCACLWLSRVLILDWILEDLEKYNCQSFKEMLIGVAISQHSFWRRTCFRSIGKIFPHFQSRLIRTNCFHPYESNTLSFLSSITRLHKLQ